MLSTCDVEGMVDNLSCMVVVDKKYRSTIERLRYIVNMGVPKCIRRTWQSISDIIQFYWTFKKKFGHDIIIITKLISVV